MPNRTIDSNHPQTTKVQIYGSDSNRPLASSNGLLAVSLSGTPTVLVGNSVTIASIPSVSLNGTPTVAINPSYPLPITILTDLRVRINGHESTFITMTSSTFNSGTLNVNTPGIDVSRFGDYSYFIEATTSGQSGRYTMQPQLSAYNVDTAFTNNGNPAVLTLPSNISPTNFIVTDNNFARYSRLTISGTGDTAIGITVVFQGQY